MYQLTIVPVPGFSEPLACWSHLAAAAAFFIFSVFLVIHGRGNSLRVSALIIYGFCVVYLFSMSGVYHLLEPGGAPRGVLQRLDHSGIWTMIAGTFTPIHIILFRGISRWLVLFIVWSVAVTGLTLEVVFFNTFPEWLSLTLYLALGWLGAGSYYLYKKTFKDGLEKYLFYGGLAYSVGGVFEFLRWPVLIQGIAGPHEVFHFMVILAAGFHAKFIYTIAPDFITQKLTIRVKERGKHEAFIVATSEHLRIKLRNRDFIRERIAKELGKRYRGPWMPKVIRIKTEKEIFLSPEDPGNLAVRGQTFYRLKYFQPRNHQATQE